jgi:hypothetical protein
MGGCWWRLRSTFFEGDTPSPYVDTIFFSIQWFTGRCRLQIRHNKRVKRQIPHNK